MEFFLGPGEEQGAAVLRQGGQGRSGLGIDEDQAVCDGQVRVDVCGGELEELGGGDSGRVEEPVGQAFSSGVVEQVADILPAQDEGEGVVGILRGDGELALELLGPFLIGGDHGCPRISRGRWGSLVFRLDRVDD